MVARKGNEPTGKTTLERSSDREIVIKRTFRAPAQMVFDVYTRQEHVRLWWAPKSRGVSVVVCEVDLRPGGAYRYVIARSEREQYAFSGKYLEVAPPTRLVYTQSFEPHPGEAVITISFTERDGSTDFVARELYPSQAALEMALTSGMEEGMRETFEQLDALIVSLAR